jgi:hypothetical protein
MKNKGKGKSCPCAELSTTPWRRIGEWRYSSTHSLTSKLDGGEWSALRPCRFTFKEGARFTHWIGDWVGPRAVLDAVVKRKIPNSRRESNHRTPIVQFVAQRYTDWAITALFIGHTDRKRTLYYNSVMSRYRLEHHFALGPVSTLSYDRIFVSWTPKNCFQIFRNPHALQ